MTAGQHQFEWDDLNQYGQTASDGSYQYEITAVDAEGDTVTATTFTTGTVSGVYYKDGTAYLLTPDQEIPLGNVVQVYDQD